MIRRLVVLAILAGTVALVTSGVSSAKVYAKCIPNKQPGSAVEKQRHIRIFCGSAKVTFRQSGVTSTITSGMCLRYPTSLVVGIGKLTQLRLNLKPLYKAYFVAFPALKDGTFKNVVGRYQMPGRETPFVGTFVITQKRSKATFKGHALTTNRRKLGPALSGTITCK